ncbi:MAG: hypothetical protein ACYTGX_18350 [Planctomycetota bacterium]|jgi:hypothetical protein
MLDIPSGFQLWHTAEEAVNIRQWPREYDPSQARGWETTTKVETESACEAGQAVLIGGVWLSHAPHAPWAPSLSSHDGEHRYWEEYIHSGGQPGALVSGAPLIVYDGLSLKSGPSSEGHLVIAYKILGA